MGDILVTTFRPRNHLRADYDEIIEWCQKNNSSISAVFNSYLPAINYALHHKIVEHEGARYVQSDFADVLLLENHKG